MPHELYGPRAAVKEQRAELKAVDTSVVWDCDSKYI
ncbi:hypothetical protein W822_17400 [Advenella kashmirensis W13003]|uniref:Uncharacterized protein n=1 Tax=Advenella kashmirensis W13003 TaxID=1424334 RepID=V8QPX0_9BURK|nr:hypothetical protein W822_17400 [Advenella kashmirensis W13003]